LKLFLKPQTLINTVFAAYFCGNMWGNVRYVQANFEYDGKKSGGITKSHLRFGKQPIQSAYCVTNADFVACHNQSYLYKYDMLTDLREGGSFLLNCQWKKEKLEENLPASFKKQAAEKKIKLFIIDATDIARDLGLGGRINAILQAAFFKIANIIPSADAVKYMKASIEKSYGSKGEKIIAQNYAAVDGIDHPANLGPQLAYEFAKQYGAKAFVVNPPDVDEFDDVARVCGLASFVRGSSIHALNQKEVALRYAKSVNKRYEELNLIVCHIGGGISVTAHRRGRMVDSNDIARGEGPMTPTRSGALPAAPLISLCFSGKFTEKEMQDKVIKNGGLIDHLGTSDCRKVVDRAKAGDSYAALVFNAMIYQIAKEIGARAIALKGQVDAIVLTGGISYSEEVVEGIRDYAGWLAPIATYPGEHEMEALAYGALRVLREEEIPREYTGIPPWKGFPQNKGEK
jgi:butyrate kinase